MNFLILFPSPNNSTCNIQACLYREKKKSEVILHFQSLPWKLVGIIFAEVSNILFWHQWKPRQININYSYHQNFKVKRVSTKEVSPCIFVGKTYHLCV